MGTPKIKKENRTPKSAKLSISDRGEPEGNSIKKKNIPKISPEKSAKKRKVTDNTSKKNQKAEHNDEKDNTLNSKKTKTPKLTKPQKIKDLSGVSSNKTKKLKKEGDMTNTTNWAAAVEKARGEPDGGASSNPDGDVTTDADNVTTDADNSTWTPQKKQKNSSGVEEKKEKKPFKVLKVAAKKFKKTTTKELKEKGVKREADKSDDTSETKKAKVDMNKKERKLIRRQHKDNYEVAHKAKLIWEQLRRHDCKTEKRQKLSKELFDLVKGNAKQMIFAHDTARVVQCLMKYGSLEQRNHVFEELKGDMVAMSKSKYSKFFVKRMLKHGSKDQRNLVLKSFHGHVKKLIRHSEASEIVEFGYNEWANAQQRAALVEEFYGPSYALFKSAEKPTLDHIMTSEPLKREQILSNMKETLVPLIDKNIVIHSLVHRIFSEYFTYATPKLRGEMIEALRESIVHMLHTRDGARVAMNCIWHGTTKDRKVIIKSFKLHVIKIAKEEYGHMTLQAIFDVVDDTKLVSKAIVDELLKNTNELYNDAYGRKVLMYLLCPRDPHHFHSDLVKVLQKGDGNASSKKEMSQRRAELLEVVSGPLLQYIVDNTRALVLNNSTLVLLLAVLTHAKGDPTAALQAVADIAVEPIKAEGGDVFNMVVHPAGHLTLKRLILNDKERHQAGQSVLFSSILVSALPEGTLKSWTAYNRGCFIIISLLDTELEEVVSRIREELQPIKKSLVKLDFKGAEVLLKKL